MGDRIGNGFRVSKSSVYEIAINGSLLNDQTVTTRPEEQIASWFDDTPVNIFLHINAHKEFYVGYRHAWGNAWVSSDREGTQAHPVISIRFRVEMPTPGGQVVDDRTAARAASCDADCNFGGVVAGDFTAHFQAWATALVTDSGGFGFGKPGPIDEITVHEITRFFEMSL